MKLFGIIVTNEMRKKGHNYYGVKLDVLVVF